MSEASELRAELTALFAPTAYGRAMTVTRTTPGAYADDGSAGAPTTTTFAGVGRVGNYRDALIDGTRILNGDRQITFVPDNIAYRAEPGDTITVGADVYAIIAHKLREIGGELISYTLQVR
jgi:hypothetical protein